MCQRLWERYTAAQLPGPKNVERPADGSYYPRQWWERRDRRRREEKPRTSHFCRTCACHLQGRAPQLPYGRLGGYHTECQHQLGHVENGSDVAAIDRLFRPSRQRLPKPPRLDNFVQNFVPTWNRS